VHEGSGDRSAIASAPSLIAGRDVDVALLIHSPLARRIEAPAAGETARVEARSVVAFIEAQRQAIETADVLNRSEALELANAGRGSWPDRLRP
jgi:hypothetical protein